MSKWRRISEHPLAICVAVVLGTSAVAVPTTIYFERLRCSMEKLESGPIERVLGDEDSFDLQNTLLSEAAPKNIPAGSTYFPEAGFYAATTLPPWTFRKTSDLALMGESVGQDVVPGV